MTEIERLEGEAHACVRGVDSAAPEPALGRTDHRRFDLGAAPLERHQKPFVLAWSIATPSS